MLFERFASRGWSDLRAATCGFGPRTVGNELNEITKIFFPSADYVQSAKL
ncbi:Uncharacterized protein dnm_067820 [Desulfonema magnum]|uniref:Uncharacterized protein n=1 Tax=Desulfonema magnum TaxID=45655 RepID=A0A975BS79_9BACT|nr:Uncharacterized protein dnm_067820 [Desulfonema magnum]